MSEAVVAEVVMAEAAVAEAVAVEAAQLEEDEDGELSVEGATDYLVYLSLVS